MSATDETPEVSVEAVLPRQAHRARRRSFRFRDEHYALVAIVTFFCALATHWLLLDAAPPSWDEAAYLDASLKLHDALTERGIAGYVREFAFTPTSKAPLIAVLPAPLYLIAGRDYSTARYLLVFCLAILLCAAFAIANRLWSTRVGLLTAAILGSMPLVYGLSHWFLVELPMAALVTTVIWLVLYSHHFERRWAVVVLGTLSGLGLLLKVLYPVYAALPIAVAAWRAKRLGKWRPSLLAEFLVPSAVVALPWYSLHWQRVLQHAADSSFGDIAAQYGSADVFSLSAIGAYLGSLLHSISFYYAGASAVLVLLTLALPAPPDHNGRGSFRHRTVLMMGWLAPIMIFVLGKNKDIRFIAPFLPPVAILIAVGLDQTLNRIRRHRALATAAFLIYPLFAAGATSLGYMRSPLAYLRHPVTESWPHLEILRTIVSSDGGGGRDRKPLVILGTDRERLNHENLRLAATQGRYAVEFGTTAWKKDVGALLSQLPLASAFLHVTGHAHLEPSLSNSRYHEEVVSAVRSSPRFVPLTPRQLPDGSTLHIYLNRFANRFEESKLQAAAFIPSGASEPGTIANVTFGGMVALTGIGLRTNGNALTVDYRWTALKPADRDYICFTHVLDESGKPVGYLDHSIANGTPPMRTWAKGDRVIESVTIPFKATAGKPIRLLVGLYFPPTGDRLQVGAGPVVDGDPATTEHDNTAVSLLLKPAMQNP